MKNEKILELINDGKIDELKTIIKEEIYKDSLKGIGNCSKRYAAMKRYFKSGGSGNTLSTQLPCKDILINGEKYNCFLNGYTFVCTKESIGELKSYDNSKNDYFNIEKLIVFNDTEKLDLNNIIAKAKSNGYRYKKSELVNSGEFKHVFKYRDGYYKVANLDQAFSIINDGDTPEVYYTKSVNPLIIKTSLGICGIVPLYKKSINEREKIIINIDSKYDEIM